MIELRHLRYFVALGKAQHFTRAAEKLHLTQPALSRQIAALEDELGVRIIDRKARRVQLTQAGQHFLTAAQNILLSVDQACKEARAVAAGTLGELTIGFMMHAAYSSVPILARKLLQDQPNVRLQLREAFPSALISGVLEGHFDAGIGFNIGTVRGLASFSLQREPLCLAVSSSHHLALHAQIRPQDLVDQELITSPADVAPELRNAITAYLAPNGMNPRIRLETQLQQTIVSLVAEEIGVALIPQSLSKIKMAGVVFKPLVNPPNVEQVLFWRVDNGNRTLSHLIAAVKVWTKNENNIDL